MLVAVAPMAMVVAVEQMFLTMAMAVEVHTAMVMPLETTLYTLVEVQVILMVGME